MRCPLSQFGQTTWIKEIIINRLWITFGKFAIWSIFCLQFINKNNKMTFLACRLKDESNYYLMTVSKLKVSMFFISARGNWHHLSTLLKSQMSSTIIKITNLTANRWCCVPYNKLSIYLEPKHTWPESHCHLYTAVHLPFDLKIITVILLWDKLFSWALDRWVVFTNSKLTES